jgi:hypothetical protein
MGTFCHICGYDTPGLPHLARITANLWTNAPITVITWAGCRTLNRPNVTLGRL